MSNFKIQTTKPKSESTSIKKCVAKLREGNKRTDSDDKYIHLTEEIFGEVLDKYGNKQNVKRFTWTSHYNIKIQVITYGARITSIKLPSHKGVLEDIVWGFDNLAGYLFYKDLYLGATIGRFSGKIKNSKFKLDEKSHCLTTNSSNHHINGGNTGFDKVNWTPKVENNKVILRHLSLDGEEGYPGNLITTITFEMIHNDQFSIDIKAISSKPTIVNITNSTYFNLAGHSAGSAALYEHQVTTNANHFTPLDINGFPTGEVSYVRGTDYDFRVPKRLNKVNGDGFDVNLCVNHNPRVDNSFVARVLHEKTGRILDIFSNQYGVNFESANNFPEILELPEPSPSSICAKASGIVDLLNRIHAHMTNAATSNEESDYAELRDLTRNLEEHTFFSLIAGATSALEDINVENCLEEISLFLLNESPEKIIPNPMQRTYLGIMKDFIENNEGETDYSEIRKVIIEIIDNSRKKFQVGFPENVPEIEGTTCPSAEQPKVSAQKKKEPTYEEGTVHGKNGAIYVKHGAMSLQTQNYPDAVNHTEFPSCILRPGQLYHHTILYGFCIRPPHQYKR